MFESIKKHGRLYNIALVMILVIFLFIFCLIVNNIKSASESSQDILKFTLKVSSASEKLNTIFELAEVNVNLITDSIANSYDIRKQQDRAYNFQFIERTDALVKSVISNTPNADGAWFQLNADLPFSVHAYNWFEFKGNEFINVKNELEGTSSVDREITQEDDPYYYSAIESKGLTWSSVYTDADTKDEMITISSPIYKEGSLVGVAGLDMSTKNLQLVMQNIQSNLEDSEFYLLDKKNNLILAQLRQNISSAKIDTAFISLFEDHNDNIVEYKGEWSKKTAILIPLVNGYKFVVTTESKNLFNRTTNLINLIIVLFVLLIISTAMVFVAYFRQTNQIPSKIIKESSQEDLEEHTEDDAEDNLSEE